MSEHVGARVIISGKAQGALEGATLLVVAFDVTRNTGKKTSQIVYFILAEALK